MAQESAPVRPPIKMKLTDCHVVALPRVTDPRGSLAFMEARPHIPFEVRRIFYLYGVPAGQTRAAHALKTCQQFIMAISDSFDIVANDGKTKRSFRLDRPDSGLFVPPLVWREIKNFTPGSVCLVTASEFYNEADYLDEFGAFMAAVGVDQK